MSQPLHTWTEVDAGRSTYLGRCAARLTRATDQSAYAVHARTVAIFCFFVAGAAGASLLLVPFWPYPEGVDAHLHIRWALSIGIGVSMGLLWLRAGKIREVELGLTILGMQLAMGTAIVLSFSGSVEGSFMIALSVLTGALMSRSWTIFLTITSSLICLIGPFLHPQPSLDPVGEGTTLLAAMLPMTLAAAASSRYLQTLLVRVRQSADLDPLTGIGNRRALDRYLAEVTSVDGGGKPFDYVIMDLDHFKRINDTLGHAHGDTVLIATARAVEEAAPLFAARSGGEEFVVVFPPDRTFLGCMQILDLLSEYAGSADRRHVTASFGVASYPHDGTTHDELLRSSDMALYEAKRNGRARIVAAASLVPEACLEAAAEDATIQEARPAELVSEEPPLLQLAFEEAPAADGPDQLAA